MMHIWITVNIVANTALAVVALAIAGYTVSAKPAFAILYYGVVLICALCAAVGFLNLPFLHSAARQQDEKSRLTRAERKRLKAEKEAIKAENAVQPMPVEPVLDAQVEPLDPSGEEPAADGPQGETDKTEEPV